MITWKIKNGELEIDKMPLVMGILNVTPDSFSDGGKYNALDKALIHVEEMINEGASIIDVGGESTRPGFTQISDEEEISRVAPVIEAISKRFDTAISIDTYKSAVAIEALNAGAHIVNDIHGFNYDPNMAKVVKDSKAGCVLMANYIDRDQSVDILTYEAMCFDKSMDIAKEAGIDVEQILLDPGIGFGTTRDEDLLLLKNLDTCPRLLLGTSRKRIVQNLLDRDVTAPERVAGSVGLALAGAAQGVKVIRVHDCKATYDALKTFVAVTGGKANYGLD